MQQRDGARFSRGLILSSVGDRSLKRRASCESLESRGLITCLPAIRKADDGRCGVISSALTLAFGR